MKKSRFLFPFLIMLFIMVHIAAGCTPLLNRFFGEDLEEEGQEGPPQLMEEGQRQFERGYWEEAIEAFGTVKDRYPYSKEAIEAELKVADALYQRKEYEEAYSAYHEFERLHPKNENIPYVIYMKGMCYFRQITTVDRAQTNTLRAKEEFERLVKRFPRDIQANKARKNIRKCLIYLAENELYVAHFYYRMGRYRAAMARYSYIIENYPDMGQYHEALEYIKRCREKIAEEEQEAVDKKKKEEKKDKG